MANEFIKGELASMIDEFQAQMTALADVHQKRAQLTAAGTALQKRVTVTLNADFVVIETRFVDTEDLTHDELAKAVTEAAQEAAAELSRKSAELMNPLQERRDRMPKMSDLIEDLPNFDDRVPELIPASLAPPNSPERQLHDPGMVFTDVEELDDLRPSRISADDW
ncbi:YbaB/EbfC family nucleoid-associated protein [Nocardia sp. NBC_01503]|uniref:YbaB/EbfC family nucleoid-associated protein n=1 Tax=Nocardia sp. NBC_01503 TaxID=2975997 RepID=UPI002E7AC01E|nr:YbaB/EbfC family nucleoid-associated protein [Nocardia sp. NBC_01503]WTL33939.1 YbaB/EbfC family nucleoid-associated protein [Nocardia sp. NBC_01503]